MPITVFTDHTEGMKVRTERTRAARMTPTKKTMIRGSHFTYSTPLMVCRKTNVHPTLIAISKPKNRNQ